LTRDGDARAHATAMSSRLFVGANLPAATPDVNGRAAINIAYPLIESLSCIREKIRLLFRIPRAYALPMPHNVS